MKLKWISQDTDRHGNVRTYVRKPGCKKVRIVAQEGRDAFFLEYTEALKNAVAKSGQEPAGASVIDGSLKYLFSRYFAECGDFRRLADATRKQMRQRCDNLCLSVDANGKRRGDKDYRSIQSQHVLTLRDEKVLTPTEANKLVSDFRKVWKWAKQQKLVTSNPANEVDMISVVSDGFHTWTREEIEAFDKRHAIGTKPRLAKDLLLFTGVRRSDVVRFGPQMIKDGWLKWTEIKGRNKVVKNRELPVLPQLQETLDRSPSGQLVFLATAYGKPFTLMGFSQWFKIQCRKAGLGHCSAHGLRKAGATIAAEQGATEKQLMAIYGWETARQAAHYTKQADRKRMAGDAMHLVAPAGTAPALSENLLPHSQTVGQKGS
jgi:integrase